MKFLVVILPLLAAFASAQVLEFDDDPQPPPSGIIEAPRVPMDCDKFNCAQLDCDIDLVFVLDSSRSIGFDNWQMMLEFVECVCECLLNGPNDVHIGLVIFDDMAETRLHLTGNEPDIKEAIAAAPFLNGNTDIAEALNLASSDVFGMPDDRPDIPNVLLLITDARPQGDFSDVEEAANNVPGTIVAIGIGNVENTNLNDISINVKMFENLQDLIQDLNEITDIACNPSTEAPPPTTTKKPHIIPCGCCWPIPEKCCKEPPTTTPPPVTEPPLTVTPPQIPPSTTTTPPPCPCEADVAIVLDRTGSVEPNEFNNVRTCVMDFLMETEDCFRTALIPFWVRAPASYTFNDPESANVDLAKIALDLIDDPSGDTDAGRGLISARAALLGDATPSDDCRAVLMFHDGGSDDKENTYQRARELRDRVGARVCLVRMVDPLESPQQQANRDNELSEIVANSVPGSRIVDEVDFVNFIYPPDLIDNIIDCLCNCTPPTTVTEPPITVPTTPSPISPTTTMTPPPCPCEGDVIIVLDRTGSIEPNELLNTQNFLVDFLNEDYIVDCWRTALIPFWVKAPVIWGLGDPASNNPAISAPMLLDDVGGPGGDTETFGAFISARSHFVNDANPTPGGCRVVLMFHDGGSDDKQATNDKAAALAAKLPDVRVCLVGMQDEGETDLKKTNRIKELEDIILSSNPGSDKVADVDFITPDIPATLLDDIKDCLCNC